MKLDGFPQISAVPSKAAAGKGDQPENPDQEFEFTLESVNSEKMVPKQTTQDSSNFGLRGIPDSAQYMELIDSENEETVVVDMELIDPENEMAVVENTELIDPENETLVVENMELLDPENEKAVVENLGQDQSSNDSVGSSNERIMPSVTVPDQEIRQPLVEEAVINNMVAFREAAGTTDNGGKSIGEVGENKISGLANPAPRQNPGNFVSYQKTAAILPEQKTINEAAKSAPADINTVPVSAEASVKLKQARALPSLPNNQQADRNKSQAIQKISSMKIENDVKLGGIKLEGVTPANFSQLIIQSIAPNTKIEAIASILPTNEQVSKQLPKTLTIQLFPRSLGVVEVRITNVNGRLNIAVETSTAAAEKLLKAEIPVLAEKLLMTGITYDEMTVKNNPNLEQFRNENQQERSNNSKMDHFNTSDQGKNREQESYQDIFESDGRQSRYSHDLDSQTSAANRDATSRKGIYL